LLVEVGNALSDAAVSDIPNPGWVTSPMSRPALTALDDPVETLKVEFVHWPEEGLGADEADGCRDLAQKVCAPCVVVRLDGDTNPDMRRPGQRLTELGEVLRALSEDLVGVPIGPEHRIEDAAGLLPSKRKIESLGPEAKIEALLIRMTRKTMEALGERHGGAVVAAGRDLGAPDDRVPCGPRGANGVQHAAGSEKPIPSSTRCRELGSPGACTYAVPYRGYDGARQPRVGGAFMKRLFIVAFGLSLSLSVGGVQRDVLAQPTAAPVISGNVIGTCGAGTNAGDATISCGDLIRAPGMTVITPAGAEKGSFPMDVAPAPEAAPEAAPAPVDEAAPVDDPAAESTVDADEVDTALEPDIAVASETDRDADNYADALEVEMGLDPTTIDTDGDGVADGDEGTLYGTDPTVVDTDGDGVSDGGELFDVRTDPLVWNDFAVDSADVAPEEGVAEEVAADEVPEVAAESPGDSAALAQETKEDVTATNGDAAALGTGNASSAPGTVTRAGVSGTSLLGPDGTYRVSENSPPIVNVPSGTRVEIAPPAAPEPVADTTVDETSEPGATDTDGDGVADSDEIDVYGTDPETWDTDGDNLADGDELLVGGTDPLLWDTNGDGISDGGVEAAVDSEPVIAEDAAPVVADPPASDATGVDSDNDRLADANEAAVGTDPTTPDADGDGYYDGDEVNLGTNPLDAASFPVG
jgi:hypothetical protein